MFLEYFYHAREYLRQHGLKAEVIMGAPVPEHDLEALDAETDFPMPLELRQFYREVGDGFAFIPDKSEVSDLVGWEYMHLTDHKIWNRGFGAAIEEDATMGVRHASPSTSPELLEQEMKRRKQWMLFYGFVGGGDVLCLDLSVTPSPVKFHQAQVWVDLPHRWEFLLASSFTEFVVHWSRYHFLTPAGEWTSFCRERSGRFDWAPHHFPQI